MNFELPNSSNSVEIKFPLYTTRFAPLAVESLDLMSFLSTLSFQH